MGNNGSNRYENRILDTLETLFHIKNEIIEAEYVFLKV